MKAARRVLCIFTFALYVVFALFLAVTTHGDMGPGRSPLGFDFSADYEAAQLARHGATARAYDDEAFLADEQARFPESTLKLPWNYPPIFQALLLPFSVLPYFEAFASWTTLLLGAHLAFTRRVAAPSALWPLLLFPGAVINLFLGASGLLLALFVGCGLFWLDRRPRLSGAFFALAMFKPHLALLAPVALLLNRRHRALVAMLATVLVLVAGTSIVFGANAWLAFFAKATHASNVATSSSSDWARVPTVYTLVQVVGLGKTGACIMHAMVALAAVVAMSWLWKSKATPAIRGGALALALLIVTPYARIYDFALLLFPILALIDEPDLVDRSLVALMWIAPLVGLLVQRSTPWLALLPLLALVRLAMKARQPISETGSDISAHGRIVDPEP
jgi:hypothetical protein